MNISASAWFDRAGCSRFGSCIHFFSLGQHFSGVMIIMRALVATVLLITVVLVSIVLINANARHERDSETIPRKNEGSKSEVDRSDLEVLFENSFERMGLKPLKERTSLETKEVPTDMVKSTTERSSLNAITKVVAVKHENSSSTTTTTSKVVSKKEQNYVEGLDMEDELIIANDDSGVDFVQRHEEVINNADEVSSPTTQPLSTDDEYSVDDEFIQDQPSNAEVDEKYFESKTMTDIKTRSKENQWAVRKSLTTTDRQTPLGYEPESYIVLDEEPTVSANPRLSEDKNEQDDLDLSRLISSRPLERKQRAVVDSPETIVLNRAPIVPHVGTYKEPGCPQMFPPPMTSRYAKSFERSHSSYPGMPSIYNPNHWDSRNMNMLKFPHCAACQRKHAPLCVTCGRCSECCGHSGCTCGCLNSQ